MMHGLRDLKFKNPCFVLHWTTLVLTSADNYNVSELWYAVPTVEWQWHTRAPAASRKIVKTDFALQQESLSSAVLNKEPNANPELTLESEGEVSAIILSRKWNVHVNPAYTCSNTILRRQWSSRSWASDGCRPYPLKSTSTVITLIWATTTSQQHLPVYILSHMNLIQGLLY